MERKLMTLNGKHPVNSIMSIFNSKVGKVSLLKYLGSYASREAEYDTNKYAGQ